MDRRHILEQLEQTGLLRTLMLLSEKKRFITELKRSSTNPGGIGSFDTIQRVRDRLLELGLAETVVEEGPPKTIYLKLTEKGEQIVELLNRIVDTIRTDDE